MKFKNIVLVTIYALTFSITQAQDSDNFKLNIPIDYKKEFVTSIIDEKQEKIYIICSKNDKKGILNDENAVKIFVYNKNLEKITEKTSELSQAFFIKKESPLEWFDEIKKVGIFPEIPIYKTDEFKPLLSFSTDSDITLLFQAGNEKGLSTLKIDKNSLAVKEEITPLSNLDKKEKLVGVLNDTDNKKIFTINANTSYFNIYDFKDPQNFQKIEINSQIPDKTSFKSYFEGMTVIGEKSDMIQAAYTNKLYVQGNILYLTHEQFQSTNPWAYQYLTISKIDLDKKTFKMTTEAPSGAVPFIYTGEQTDGATYICDNKLFKIYSDKKKYFYFTIKDLDSVQNYSPTFLKKYIVKAEEDSISFKNSPMYMGDDIVWFDKKKHKNNAKYFFKHGVGSAALYTIFAEKVEDSYLVKIGTADLYYEKPSAATPMMGTMTAGNRGSFPVTTIRPGNVGGLVRYESYFVSFLDAKSLEHEKDIEFEASILDKENASKSNKKLKFGREQHYTMFFAKERKESIPLKSNSFQIKETTFYEMIEPDKYLLTF